MELGLFSTVGLSVGVNNPPLPHGRRLPLPGLGEGPAGADGRHEARHDGFHSMNTCVHLVCAPWQSRAGATACAAAFGWSAGEASTDPL